jgi:hypothetical protein
MRTTFLLPLTLIVLATTPSAAQQIAPTPFARFEASLQQATPAAEPARQRPAAASLATGRFAADPGSVPSRRPDTATLVFAGVLGGAAGLVAGGLVGDRFQGTPCEDCYLAGFAGAVLGESLGVPLAVHLAAGRRGQAAPGMVASLAIAAGGLVAAGRLGRAELLLAVPVLQIATAVASQRHTAGGHPN